MHSRSLFAAAALFACPAAACAQGFVESVRPPVVEAGKTTRVTFVGRGFGAALDVWHSLPPGALTANVVESTAERAVFDVTAAKDAPVGVCGLRLATRDGLANAVLFLVEDLAVRPGEPGALPLHSTVWGTLREGAIDRYPIEVRAGERVSFEAVANRFGKDADPLVTVRDAAGKVVAERDNDPGLYFDCRFAHTFEKGGTYTVEVRDARFKGNEHHLYALRVGRFPAGRVAVQTGKDDVRLPETGETFRVAAGEAGFAALRGKDDRGSAWVPLTAAEGAITAGREPDPAVTAAFDQATSPAAILAFRLSPFRTNPFLSLDKLLHTGRLQPTPAAVPGVLGGVLTTPGQPRGFLLTLEKGQRIVVKAEARELNSPADLELWLTDRTGREVRRGNAPRPDDEPTLDFTAPAPGSYGLFVRDTLRDGSPAHAFHLTVRSDPFPPPLTAEVEGLTVPQGSYQPVPIVVARGPGAAGAIKLKLTGAPPGLRLTPDEIGEKESAVVCKLEATSAAPLGVHTVRILADAGDGAPQPVRTRPLIDRQRHNVDLILYALREDQRRLPPSLTDRFAVQVTPPAHFTFELPEPRLTLARFLRVDVPVVTTRVPGFDGPISFAAKGGQLAPKEEGRTRVFAEFPDATPQTPRVAGYVQSKILSNVAKSRIEVTGSGTHAGRRVSLTRTFELDLTTAFKITAEPPKLALLPGERARVRLLVDRLPVFDGPVTLELRPMFPGVPETLTIPKGETGVDLDIEVPADTPPRRQGLQLTANGDVGGFEEEFRATPLEVEVKKVEPPKKK